MKKKHYLITALLLLVSQFLPIANTFAVDTTEEGPKPDISVAVSDNGTDFGSNARIGNDGTLTFKATLSRVNSSTMGKEIAWSYISDNGTININPTTTNEYGEAIITLTYEEIKNVVSSDKNYLMTASYSHDNNKKVENKVAFGILGENPAVVFTSPGQINNISMKDELNFGIKVYENTSSNPNIKWECFGLSCPAVPSSTTQTAPLKFSTIGTYKIRVTVTDSQDKTGSDEVTVTVVEDPPKITAFTTDKPLDKYHPGDTATIKISAKDEFGTINKITWGCGNSEPISLDSSEIFDPAKMAIKDYKITVTLPDFETESYTCKVKLTDDDGEESIESVIFKVAKEIPPEEDSKEEISSPDTGAMTKQTDSASETAITIIATATILAVAAFIVIKRLAVL